MPLLDKEVQEFLAEIVEANDGGSDDGSDGSDDGYSSQTCAGDMILEQVKGIVCGGMGCPACPTCVDAASLQASCEAENAGFMQRIQNLEELLASKGGCSSDGGDSSGSDGNKQWK